MLCAVSFNRYGRLYYLDPGTLSVKVGDRVLVPTDDGHEVAECVWAPQWVSDDTSSFPQLIGLARDDDMRRDALMRKRKAEAKVAAKRLIREHALPMKVVAVDHVLEAVLPDQPLRDRKSTRLNSSHMSISYAVFCLKKKKKKKKKKKDMIKINITREEDIIRDNE